MKLNQIFAFALSLAFTATSLGAQPLCQLFPAGTQFGAVSQERNSEINVVNFQKMVDRVQKLYDPVFRSMGQKFVLVGNWTSNEFNAFASIGDNGQRQVEILGGIARAKEMTTEGLYLVMCHEIGHHLAGQPAYPEGMAAEGQSDYYGTLVCLRRLFMTENNQLALRGKPVDTYSRLYCSRQYKDAEEQAICIRSVMAGLSLAKVLNMGRGPRIQDRDRVNAPATVLTHPDAQCRLDTYTAGALCPIGNQIPASLAILIKGNCNPAKVQQATGSRPGCWFNAKVAAPIPAQVPAPAFR